jgi:hypothetical protein
MAGSTKTATKRRDTRFKKGNKLGKKFRPGDRGGPGRPPTLSSPRAQLKRYAESVAPVDYQRKVKKLDPNIDVSQLTWAELVAITHLVNAADGSDRAIAELYKQIDDHGADIHQLEVRQSPSERIAEKLKRLRTRKSPMVSEDE